MRLPSLTAKDATTWLAVAVVVWTLYRVWPRHMTWVRSTVTGKVYYVKNLPDAAQVADRLAALEVRLVDFLKRAEEHAPGDRRLANIRARWSGTLSEIVHDAEVAYSMGKDTVSLCLRDAATGELEAENTSMFVLLHELAHVATDEYGHPPQFWTNMKFLLELAEKTGSYVYQDFDRISASYCGRPLTGSPLTCVKRKTCGSELPPSKQ